MGTSSPKILFRRLYYTIVKSIAFYPVLLSALMVGLAWLCLYLDTMSFGKKIFQEFIFLRIDQASTARGILGALAGALFTLMVFSFSMVMVVLNQAASSYSPRILPGLVSKTDHQIVLGIYLGTIGFTLAVFSNVGSEIFDDGTPRFSIIVNLVLTFISLVAFVYFIHEISSVIQIGSLLKRLHHKTRSSLLQELTGKEYTTEPVHMDKGDTVKAWQSGYFFKVDERALAKKAKEIKLQVSLLKAQGAYLVEGEPFLEINCHKNEKVMHLLKQSFLFQHQELVADNFYYGFKQITEVAVKALSPGINDPGTALQAINLLRDLMSLLFELEGRRVIKDKNGLPLLIYTSISFKEVFYLCISSIRNYASQDITVQVKLIELIKTLKKKDKEGKFQELFDLELQAIKKIAEENLLISHDQDYVRHWINGTPAESHSD